ncbi:MAG: mismatch-specific glycosylase [Ilumatobacteraceae bacterium]|nr:mismatch-specific glycosylase [Ilumatobacteraceae bacterium]
MNSPQPPRLTRAELEQFNGATVDDLLDERSRLLFVGINPGLWTAAVNAHFARGGNRFWPALHAAGIVPRVVDARAGMSAADTEMVLAAGIGITNLVPTASARADELSRQELLEGGARLTELVSRLQPRVVAMLGITAYRVAFGRRDAALGLQSERLAGSELWVLPNPSGLNAHETVESLGRWYRAAADAAQLRNFVT